MSLRWQIVRQRANAERPAMCNALTRLNLITDLPRGWHGFATKAENSTMIRRRLLRLLEHGTVPAMALAIAIASADSRSWQRHDLTKPAKLRTNVLFSASTRGTMTLASRNSEPAVASTKTRCLTAELTARTTRDTADHGQTN
jgi:hypothetical protein